MTSHSPHDEDEPRDRARRRLIKLGVYLAPAIVSMTAYLRRADARPTHIPQVVPTGAGPDALATVKPR